MLAAMNGRLGVLRQLSEAGADPLVKNDVWTYYALFSGRE